MLYLTGYDKSEVSFSEVKSLRSRLPLTDPDRVTRGCVDQTNNRIPFGV